MKKKGMNKRIALLTIALSSMMMVAGCSNNKEQASNMQVEAQTAEDNAEEIMEDSSEMNEPIVGGWSVAENNEITDDLRKVFDKATETITGAEYTPVLYLSSQVVAGTNHAFLCKAEPSVEELKTSPTWEIVYIYEDLKGNCEITNTESLQVAAQK